MDYDKAVVEKITALVISVMGEMGILDLTVPVGISAHHLHLQKEHVEALFGKNYTLTPLKHLSQPGQFAANETVELVGPRGAIGKIRVLGPERAQTQVEIAFSDARKLGIDAPVRSSGNIKGTPGIKIRTDRAEIEINEGVIIADRHIHMTEQDAKIFDVTDGEKVNLMIDGPKGGVLSNTTIRVSNNYALDCHLDTDDASAFQIQQGQYAIIQKNQRA